MFALLYSLLYSSTSVLFDLNKYYCQFDTVILLALNLHGQFTSVNFLNANTCQVVKLDLCLTFSNLHKYIDELKQK